MSRKKDYPPEGERRAYVRTATKNVTRKEKRELKKSIRVADEVVRIIQQYLPCLLPELKKITDKRKQGYVEYHIQVILFVQILGYIVGSKSMKEMVSTFDEELFVENVNNILKEEIEEMPHYDTINDVLKKVSVDELRKVIKKIVYELIRKKMFDKYRMFDKYFQVIVDGTGLCSFKERHCEHCLTREHKNKETGEVQSVTYYHYVLEAKLCVGNLVISIDTEFVENEKEDVDKQDCELNAFKRMAVRIKKEFPRLPIVITGDALYACKPVMDICNGNGWKYILRFKNDRIPSLGQEVEAMEQGGLLKEKSITIMDDKKKETERIYKYSNNVHVGKAVNSDEGYEVNVVKLYETKGDTTTSFMWITSINITENKVAEIANTGRKRWKIENEGFNEQKRGTFNIEHLYCTDWNAMKIHYLLTQIAHMIRQLLEHGSIILKEAKFTKREISNIIVKELTTIAMACDSLNVQKQLRFDYE